MILSNRIGYIILSFFVVLLLGATLINLFTNDLVFFTVFIFLTIGCLFAMVSVYKKDVLEQKPLTLSKTHGYDFLAVFIGSVITYTIHTNTALCAVLTAGMVGILAALFVKKWQVPAYCGAFVGMSSPLLLGFLPFILASFLAGIVFVLAKNVYNGYGGKLGTIAFSGALLSWLPNLDPFVTRGEAYLLSERLAIVFVALFAATLTYSMSTRLHHGPVLASGLVGFFGGAILRMLPLTMGSELSVVMIGASFVGMSGIHRFKHEGLIMISGIIFGLIFIYSEPYFGGAGGKLGTIAFVSVLCVGGLSTLFKRLNDKNKTECQE